MAINLENLYLGCADGDDESNKEDFLDLFYTGNNKYDEITNDSMKFIIYGQKGTGKTILGRYIEKKCKSSGVYCKICNKNDITLSKIIENGGNVLRLDESVQFFKWAIYYQIYKVIKDVKLDYKIKINKDFYKKYKKLNECKKARKKLKDLFEDRYKNGNYELLDFCNNNENSMSGEIAADVDIALKPKAKYENKFSQNTKYVRKEFYKVIEELEVYILKCLEVLNVVIILDDLDELEICLDNDKWSTGILNKLIEAIKDVNILFSQRKLSPSKCILLIRSDIIEELNKRSTNMNKIISDNCVELYWITKENQNPEKHMLMEMILNKIKGSCQQYKNLDNKALYQILFPEVIGGKTAISYMINNSFGRPRDIICYLNIIKRKCRKDTAFRATMFKECMREYSEAFLKELYNSMKIHIDLYKTEEYLNLLRDFGRNTFYYNELLKYYNEHKSNYKNIEDLESCLKTLYKFGVIGNSRKNGKNGPVYSWGYRKDGNPNINLELKLSIHYGLRKALNTSSEKEKTTCLQ